MHCVWDTRKVGSRNSMCSGLLKESLTLLRLLCKSPIKCIRKCPIGTKVQYSTHSHLSAALPCRPNSDWPPTAPPTPEYDRWRTHNECCWLSATKAERKAYRRSKWRKQWPQPSARLFLWKRSRRPFVPDGVTDLGHLRHSFKYSPLLAAMVLCWISKFSFLIPPSYQQCTGKNRISGYCEIFQGSWKDLTHPLGF